MVVNPRRREACTTELTRDFWIWVGEQRGKEGKKLKPQKKIRGYQPKIKLMDV